MTTLDNMKGIVMENLTEAYEIAALIGLSQSEVESMSETAHIEAYSNYRAVFPANSKNKDMDVNPCKNRKRAKILDIINWPYPSTMPTALRGGTRGKSTADGEDEVCDYGSRYAGKTMYIVVDRDGRGESYDPLLLYDVATRQWHGEA